MTLFDLLVPYAGPFDLQDSLNQGIDIYHNYHMGRNLNLPVVLILI